MTKRFIFKSAGLAILFAILTIAIIEWRSGPEPTCDMSEVALPCAYYARFFGWDWPLVLGLAIILWLVALGIKVVQLSKKG